MDQRTTLMVMNIPTKLTQKCFKELLNDGFAGRFDFVYVPLDWKTGGALGYAFVNLTHVADVLPFYERFHGFSLPYSNSTKIWRVAYAHLQGPAELAAHFTLRSANTKIKPEFINIGVVPTACTTASTAAQTQGSNRAIEGESSHSRVD